MKAPGRLKLGSVATSAVLRFVVGGVLAALIIIGGAYWVVSRNAVAEATRNAQEVAAIDGHGIAEPALSRELVNSDPSALAAFDALVKQRILSSRVVRVKLWTPTGRIVYSDVAALEGRVFPLEGGELAAINEQKVVAVVSELAKPENQFERPYGRLLEVYLPIRAPDGGTLLFETYQVYSSIDDDQRRIWAAFFPVLAGGILLLLVVQVPLAWRLARSLESSLREQESLLQRALDASAAERRRIARDLHDGVVQTLAGAAFSLSAAAARTAQATPAELEEVLVLGAQSVRHAARDLRTLIVDIAPPNLEGSRLEGALADILSPLEADGIQTTLRAERLEVVDRESAALLYRAAQEAIRNAGAHAGAKHIDVALVANADSAELEVRDDGKGFTVEDVMARQADGHVGLAMLRSLVEDGGGHLSVSSEAGKGTRIRVKVEAR